jgi:hypothetical protein
VPGFRNVRELLSFTADILQVRILHYYRLYIHSTSDHCGLLKGLDFLHSHRIVHLVGICLIVDHASQPISHLTSQDIAFGNILINQFTHDSMDIWDLEARAHLRTGGRALAIACLTLTYLKSSHWTHPSLSAAFQSQV